VKGERKKVKNLRQKVKIGAKEMKKRGKKVKDNCMTNMILI